MTSDQSRPALADADQPSSTPHQEPLSAEQLARQSFSGFIWLMSGNLLIALLGLAVLSALARMLSPEDFGLMATAGIFIGLAQKMGKLGIGPALVQQPHLSNESVQVAATMAASQGAAATLLVCMAAPQLAQFLDSPSLVGILYALSPVFLLSSFAVVPGATLQREMNFRALAKVQLFGYVAYGVGAVSLALMGWGLWALVAASLIQAILRGLLLFARSPHSLKPSLNWQRVKEILGYSGGIALASLLYSAASNADYLVIGRYLGMGSLGLYERAFRLTEMPLRPSSIADRIYFAGMSRLQGSRKALAITYRRSLNSVSMGYLPLSAAIAVLAPEIVRLVLGSVWETTGDLLRVLALGVFLRAAGNVPASVLKAAGRVYSLAFVQFATLGLIVLGAWYACRWNLTFVAAAVMVAMLIRYAATSWLALRSMSEGWKLFLRAQYPGAVAAFCSGGLMYAAARLLRSYDSPHQLVLFVGAASGLLAFICVFVIIRHTNEDIRWVWNRLFAAAQGESWIDLLRRFRFLSLQ